MTDLTITKSGEFGVTQIQGNTERGIEFADGWNHPQLIAVDAGRIIIPSDSIEAALEGARELDLTIAEVAGL